MEFTPDKPPISSTQSLAFHLFTKGFNLAHNLLGDIFITLQVAEDTRIQPQWGLSSTSLKEGSRGMRSSLVLGCRKAPCKAPWALSWRVGGESGAGRAEAAEEAGAKASW